MWCAKCHTSKMLCFPTGRPQRVALVVLACPLATEVYMAAAPLITTFETPPFGRLRCSARHVYPNALRNLGRIVLKLATNGRATFMNWLRFVPNSTDASDTHRSFQEDQT